jgi:predicted dinucleotide-binding enzyme
MDIAIIGSGNVGKALAGAATRAGHSVTVASAQPEHAEEAARSAGARAANSSREAVRGVDAVVLAVPGPALDAVIGDLRPDLAGKIVIDVTNRMNPADNSTVLDGSSNAEQLQAKVPDAKVVKAFNTAFASRQANPSMGGSRPDGYVAGNDADAKAQVLQLVESIGFRPVDAGDLYMARVLEGMALLNMTLQMRTNGSWQSAWQLTEPAGAS